MPAVYSHFIFTTSLIKKIPYSLNENQKSLFIIGAQGSDPLYFYGQILGRKNKENVYKVADKIHHQDPQNFISFFIEYANKQEKERKDDLYAYLYGYLSHYTLDRNMHPYVFYHSGSDGLYNHQVFEANLDLSLLIKYSMQKVKLNTIFPIKNIEKQLKEISKIYCLYANSIKINDIEDDSFIKGIKDMKVAVRLLCSPKGKTKWFFNLFMKNSAANALSIPKKLYLNYDYLNEEHREWKHPSSDYRTNDSVMDILSMAENDYLNSFVFLSKAYEKTHYRELLNNWTLEKDHDGKHYLSQNKTTNNIFK